MRHVTRAEVLRDLVINGHSYSPDRLNGLAAQLDLPVADMFVIAGHSVPAHLRPPARDLEILREFGYRVMFCDHPQLASLESFTLSLVSASSPSVPEPPHDAKTVPPGIDRFSNILDGLMRNRGFGIAQMPFTGLSRSTIRGMLSGSWHNLQQLKAMAGPLGWRFEDLAAVADEPLGPFGDCSMLCRHVGRVFITAAPLTTAQLFQAALEADRLSGRKDHGAWKPGPDHLDPCPDDGGRIRRA